MNQQPTLRWIKIFKLYSDLLMLSIISKFLGFRKSSRSLTLVPSISLIMTSMIEPWTSSRKRSCCISQSLTAQSHSIIYQKGYQSLQIGSQPWSLTWLWRRKSMVQFTWKRNTWRCFLKRTIISPPRWAIWSNSHKGYDDVTEFNHSYL